MSYAFDESWDLLSKLDGYKQPKRRILVPKMKLRERVNEPRKINFTE